MNARRTPGREGPEAVQEFIPPCNLKTKIDFRYCKISTIGRSTQSGKNRDDEGGRQIELASKRDRAEQGGDVNGGGKH